MIQLIIGCKGSGKTKTLIAMTNEATENSGGHVVCVEKGNGLTYDISHKTRLVDADEYGISGFDALYGFVAGILAGNYDITHIFVDATFKIGGAKKDCDGLVAMIEKLDALPAAKTVYLTFTVSCDESELPASMGRFIIHSHN